jgi:hypothetical protein
MTKIRHYIDPSAGGTIYPGKHAKESGWGYDFVPASPQRHVKLTIGSMLVPAAADALPTLTHGQVDTVERAILMIAGMLEDRDFEIFLGINPEGQEAANCRREADALRRLADGTLREFLGTDDRTPEGKVFSGATERGRRAQSDTLTGVVDCLLAYHRHGAALKASDMFIVRVADAWRVYESRVAHLDDPGDERWWATIELVDDRQR